MLPDDFIFQYTTNAMDAVINLQLTARGDAMAILHDFNNPRIVKVWRITVERDRYDREDGFILDCIIVSGI